MATIQSLLTAGANALLKNKVRLHEYTVCCGVCMYMSMVCIVSIYFSSLSSALKALSHDIRTIFSILRAGHSYHAPLIEKVDWNEVWAAVERANNFTRPGAIATRDATLARYNDGYRAM